MSKAWVTSPTVELDTNIDALNRDDTILQFKAPEDALPSPRILNTVSERDLETPEDVLDRTIFVASIITSDPRGSASTVWQRIIAQKEAKFFDETAIRALERAADINSLNGHFEQGSDGLYRLRITSEIPTVIEYSANVPYVWLIAQKIIAEGQDFLNFDVMASIHDDLGDADLIVLAVMLNMHRGAIAPKKTSRERKSSDRAILADFIEHADVSELFIRCKKLWGDCIKQNIPMEQIYSNLMSILRGRHISVKPQRMVSLTESVFPTVLLANAYEVWLASLRNKEAHKPENIRYAQTLSARYPLLVVTLPLYIGYTKTITSS